jgi:hypothetical protein
MSGENEESHENTLELSIFEDAKESWGVDRYIARFSEIRFFHPIIFPSLG